MNYVVLDLEWNQGDASKEAQNPEMPFEVIEIGAVKLDADMKNCGEYSRRIKPTCYNTMHFITAKLLHIHRADLENERCFPEVFEDFRKWCGDDFLFCTWGPQDLTELQRNLCYYGMDEISKGPLLYYDIQKFFSFAYEDRKIRRALEYAVDYLSIEKDIPFHRAFSDAYYTAKVYAQLSSKEVEKYVSYDVFMIPRNKREEVHKTFPTYSKYISREFENKTKAISDREVSNTKCYACGRRTKKKIKWFSVNGKHYYSLSYCKKHGYLKGKARMKRADDGNIYVIKTLKLISPEDAALIQEKQEKLRLQRSEKRKQKKEMI